MPKFKRKEARGQLHLLTNARALIAIKLMRARGAKASSQGISPFSDLKRMDGWVG